MKHRGTGRWWEGWDSLVGQGMARGECGEDLQPSSGSFHATLSQRQSGPSSELCTLLESRPLREKLCVEGVAGGGREGGLRPLSHQSFKPMGAGRSDSFRDTYRNQVPERCSPEAGAGIPLSPWHGCSEKTCKRHAILDEAMSKICDTAV